MAFDPYNNLDDEDNPLAPKPGDDQFRTPTGLPQLQVRPSEAPLQDLGNSGTITGQPAQGVSIIRGTADSSIVPDQINNLQDLANTVKGLGLDRRPSWQVQHNSPEYAKMIEASKAAQLNALSHYANAQAQATGLVEAAKARGGGGKLQDTLLADMMKKQELEKARGDALGQFQQGLVGSGAATLDAKTGKASFSDPRYEKLFGEYASALKGVTDPAAIKGINEQFQTRMATTSDWIKNSGEKVLKALPDDLMKYGQDLLPKGLDVAQAITNMRIHLQRDPATSPEAKAALALINEIQKRKEADTIKREQQALLQKSRAAVSGAAVPPVWATFSRPGEY